MGWRQGRYEILGCVATIQKSNNVASSEETVVNSLLKKFYQSAKQGWVAPAIVMQAHLERSRTFHTDALQQSELEPQSG